MPVAILIQVITVISQSLSSSMLCVECAVRDRGGPDDETGEWYCYTCWAAWDHWRWIYAFQARFLSITRESSLQMIMGQCEIAMRISVYLNGEGGPFQQASVYVHRSTHAANQLDCVPPLSSMLLINLMIVGHTHSKCDRFFSRIHAALNGHMEQLIDIVVKALRGFRAHFACWAAHDIW